MRKSTKSGRLYLDELGIEKLNFMMGALANEGSHLDLSPSKVVSKILAFFCDKYFQREKKGLESALFDKKSYIAWAQKAAKSPEEFVALIAKIHDPAPKGKKRRSSRRVVEAQNDDGDGALE